MEQLSVDITTVYCNALLAQKQLELAHEYLEMNDTLLRAGTYLEAVGRLTKSDLLTLKLEQSKAEKQVLEAEGNLKLSFQILCNKLGISNDTSLILITPDIPASFSLGIDEAMTYTLRNNPLLSTKYLSTITATQAVDRAKKQRYAETSLELTVGFNQTGRNFAESYRHPLRQDIVSVGISIPLVDWGIRKRNLWKAKEALEIAHLSEEESTLQLRREVATLVANLRLHLRTLTIVSEDITLARALQTESREKFLLGKERIETLLRANQKVREAEREYISIRKDCWNDYFSLREHLLYDWEKKISIESEYIH